MSDLSQYLKKLFPVESERADLYRARIERVCDAFLESGLADSRYESELITEGKFWSRASEALIYERIKHIDRPPRENIGVGPDFLLTDGSRRIWVEVICPEAVGIPQDWLEICLNQVGTPLHKQIPVITPPHEQILLRWTSAIKTKFDGLVGKPEKEGYLEKGIVKKDDVFVIAVNGCQFRNGPFSELVGASGLPYALEAVFPVGLRQFNFDPTAKHCVGTSWQVRDEIANQNGAPVPTGIFLDSRYQAVSAIWGIDFNGSAGHGGHEPSTLVHNPKATQPLPKGFFNCDSEFVAFPSDEGTYAVKDILADAG